MPLVLWHFVLALSSQTALQAILLFPQGSKSVHTKAFCDTALSMSISSSLNKVSVVELYGMSDLRSGPIPLPNSTMMGHSRVLDLDEFSSVHPVGVTHRRELKL